MFQLKTENSLVSVADSFSVKKECSGLLAGKMGAPPVVNAPTVWALRRQVRVFRILGVLDVSSSIGDFMSDAWEGFD